VRIGVRHTANGDRAEFGGQETKVGLGRKDIPERSPK
jgi:hypothetical protein